eukprot:CAMPEP_0178407280 /NCGR_PEP_ID=MMETSP0689_2-20121128/19348_1 /TAXON_ID=160604 /ORGANISM="Amphidinium massartii, Strain CS-259" /LENGTH=1099 /DNA_ID=CAMNT_0020028351 /DNA_START=89 /DNA_END=3388 /DNA_ORIENTATION=+
MTKIRPRMWFVLCLAGLQSSCLAQAHDLGDLAHSTQADADQAVTCMREEKGSDGSSLLFHYKVNSVQRLRLSDNSSSIDDDQTNDSISKVPVVAPEPSEDSIYSFFTGLTLLGGGRAEVARPAWTRSRGGNRGNMWGGVDDRGLGGNITSLECHKDVFAPGRGLCPDDCPFASPSLADKPCHWQCVMAEECGQLDQRTHVADRELGICRRCEIIGCRTCKEHEDVCLQCMRGFTLNADGTCWDHNTFYWRLFFVVVGVIVAIVLLWVLDLVCQKTEKDNEVLASAKSFRKRVLLRQAPLEIRKRHRNPEMEPYYPICTLLFMAPSAPAPAQPPIIPETRRRSIVLAPSHRALPEAESLPPEAFVEPPVGGPGSLLHFRFQLAALIWAIVALAGWLSLGAMIGEEVTILGTIPAEDPQQMCQAVRWGTTVRERVKDGMLKFTGIFYACTTLFSLTFAAWQTRCYNQVQHGRGTMKDYAAVFEGFPPENGDKKLEEKYAAFLQEATGAHVVGVSVCWKYAEDGEEMRALMRDMEELEGRAGEQRRRLREAAAHRGPNPVANILGAGRDAIDSVVGPALGLNQLPRLPWKSIPRAEPSAEEAKKAVQHRLKGMTCLGKCVAVFNSERDRDQAVAVFQQPTAPEFDFDRTYEPGEQPQIAGDNGWPINARKKHHEPENMIWDKVGLDNTSKFGRVLAGIVGIFCLSVVWGVCFYLPYGYYEAYTYALVGKPPGMVNEVSFTALVVAGNQMVYVLSEWISGWVGFSNTDAQQVLYVIFYTFAILLNAVVDMFIVGYTAYLSMKWQGVRTDDGIPLSELGGFEDIFRSYPMMKVCGQMVFEYNVMSCFIAPFLAEAVFTIALPYYVSERFIKTRRHLTQQDAEEIMSPMKMDLCRYADIIVNMCLATLSFFLASGWIAWNLAGLCVGNFIIMILDHYRTLRQVKGFFFSTNIIDEAAQALLCVPCALLAACVAFQAHLPPSPDEPEVEGRLGTFTVCLGTFVFHIAFHLLALWGVVPRIIPKVKKAASRKYADAAQHFPANWFSTNPIHCLRSKYIYKHDPPCIFCVRGKEKYIERNESIGLYFDGPSQCPEPSTPRMAVPKTPM